MTREGALRLLPQQFVPAVRFRVQLGEIIALNCPILRCGLVGRKVLTESIESGILSVFCNCVGRVKI